MVDDFLNSWPTWSIFLAQKRLLGFGFDGKPSRQKDFPNFFIFKLFLYCLLFYHKIATKLGERTFTMKLSQLFSGSTMSELGSTLVRVGFDESLLAGSEFSHEFCFLKYVSISYRFFTIWTSVCVSALLSVDIIFNTFNHREFGSARPQAEKRAERSVH